MMTLVGWLNQNLRFSIPLVMLLGLITGLLSESLALKLWIAPLTLLMVYPMMVGIRLKQLLQTDTINVQGWALGINFIIIPALAYGLGRLFFTDQPTLALGLLLAALLPTSGMTISWTGFAKGNVPAAIQITIIGLFIGSVLTPLYVQYLLGAHIPMELGAVFKQILLFIALPLLAGQLTRYLLIKRYGQAHFQQHLGPKFPRFSTLGVLGIVFVAMAIKANDLIRSPTLIIAILIPVLILYTLNYVISTVIARRYLHRGDGIALVYGTVMRNLSIALALAMTAFGDAGAEAALLIALAYIIQVQSAAWYVKWSDKIFPTSK
ncbi:arsenic resistance protein [Paenalcaligenes hermetiae]|uniref:Bile acid:sodium symporter n=1 Tax=Paenalcaligenes hermetiae TaxID=1157987 RepID=A0ABP9M7M7_9BURK